MQEVEVRPPAPAAHARAHRAARAAVLTPLALFAALGCHTEASLGHLAPADIESSLFLIGDAGQQDPREVGAPLDSLAMHAAVDPERAIILFVGDNVYPEGIPEEGDAEWTDAVRRLRDQVRAVPPGARGIFIPGNQDWAGETPFGLYSIRLQERLIEDLADGRDVRLLPGNGCPGPVSIENGRLRLVMLDTQWWLQEYVVRDEESDCDENTGAVTAALREHVRPTRTDQVVITAGHHPLMTGGAHGGYCGISGPFRRFGNRAQDVISGPNRTLRDSIESAFSEHPPLVYAAGHEHNLQVLRGGENVDYLLVSGAGSHGKTACGVRLRESYYVSQHRSGFMRVDILRGRGVLLRVYRYTGGGEGGLSYSRWLEPR
ncbi:MAG TPA: hypothetical protein VMM83_03055 [Longimicrobiales bacterium]|nr:hypothetical protein [Longimicrobiales bacterium]